MTEDVQGRHRKHGLLWLALGAATAILAILIVPPLVSVSRYKSQITHVMSASLGRPVRLSSVELRLLPWPGFVLNDLTVEEDPAYGAEPVLHASTVTASIRLLSLWRGRLEISRISVDDASLNVVRSSPGRWNLDPIFRTAAAKAGVAAARTAEQRRDVRLPYLGATNLRINIKNGAEKLPFSLVNSELSLWQEERGDWRIRLRGQPARTDMSLDLADTGVVRLEGSMRRAPELRQMPVHLDLEWQEAQLGQLMRLVIGSDPGWRGDLTGELHLDGTADAAQIKTRLQATGVHREEFAPAAPMDFDANCGFVYRFSERALDNLVCDSPLGDGRIQLAGALPGVGASPHFSIELDRIPVAAALDALRTVRSGFGPGLEVRGSISGKMSYDENAVASGKGEQPVGAIPSGKTKIGKTPNGKTRPVPQGPLTGSFAVEGFQLSGAGLHEPIQIPKLVLAVAAPVGQQIGQTRREALSATVSIPAGGAVPLSVTTRLALAGYEVTVHGQAALARARELAHVAGMGDAEPLDALAGDAMTVDLSGEGPWMAVEKIPESIISPLRSQTEARPSPAAGEAIGDRMSGTVTLHNVNWKTGYLANHVEISQATVHFENDEIHWDPVNFTYGPVKGTASLEVPGDCGGSESCLPRFQVQFGELDASAVQAALLGAHEPGTLLSELIARLNLSNSANSSNAPAWPQVEGVVKADSLTLGPVTLRQPSARVSIGPNGAAIYDLDAGLLDGRVHGGGTLHLPATSQDKPAYSLDGRFERLSPAAVGQLLGQRWSGGTFDADGKIQLSGFTEKDLTASAKGTLHFEWRHGAAANVPSALARFDLWTADAAVANGKIALTKSEVQHGLARRAVEGTLAFGDPPKVSLAEPKELKAKR